MDQGKYSYVGNSNPNLFYLGPVYVMMSDGLHRVMVAASYEHKPETAEGTARFHRNANFSSMLTTVTRQTIDRLETKLVDDLNSLVPMLAKAFEKATENCSISILVVDVIDDGVTTVETELDQARSDTQTATKTKGRSSSWMTALFERDDLSLIVLIGCVTIYNVMDIVWRK